MKLAIGFAFVSTAAFGQIVETVNGPRATGYLGLGPMTFEYEDIKARVNLPESFDWREHITLPEIKDQGACGSCWSQAITKSLESALIIAGKPPIDLSEQHMVSCDKQSFGCSGGFMTSADFVVRTGLTDEASFPYAARNLRCKSSLGIKAKAISYKLLGSPTKKPTIEQIKTALIEHGVLFVTVAAGGPGWSGSGPEITGCRNRSLNHMINIVKFDKDSFTIANSWGKGFGDGGYSKMKFNCDHVANDVGYVVVE